MDKGHEHSLQPKVTCARRGSWFMYADPVGFEWTTVELPVPGLPGALDGLRIVHLSDLHCGGKWRRAYDELIARIDSARADLILYTGDFVDDKMDHRRAVPILERLMPQLRSRMGTFAILGNHDVDLIRAYLPEMGVRLIDAGRAVLEADGAAIELIGLPGLARRDMDVHFVERQPAKAPGSLRIVLSHYPDHIRRVRGLDAELFLAGHTHGGQVCLPGGRPVFSHDALPKRYCKGVHRWGASWLLVSRGLGFAGIPFRFWCPAEVSLVTLGGVAD